MRCGPVLANVADLDGRELVPLLEGWRGGYQPPMDSPAENKLTLQLFRLLALLVVEHETLQVLLLFSVLLLGCTGVDGES